MISGKKYYVHQKAINSKQLTISDITGRGGMVVHSSILNMGISLFCYVFFSSFAFSILIYYYVFDIFYIWLLFCNKIALEN